jgi:hypothetical protein
MQELPPADVGAVFAARRDAQFEASFLSTY